MTKKNILLNAFIGGLTALSLFSLPGDVSAEAKHVCSPEVVQLGSQYKPLIEAKNHEGVIQLMSSILAKEPGCPYASFYRALAYTKTKKINEAIADYTNALNGYPEKDRVYYLRGISYYRIKSFAEAIADASKAIQINPGNAEYKEFRSTVYGYGVKDYQSAIQDMQAAMAQDSRQKTARNYAVLSNYYTCIRDLTSALNTVNTGLSMYPNAAGLYVGRGVVYINQNNKEAAYRDFSRACQLDPNDQFALKHRNGLAAQLGK